MNANVVWDHGMHFTGSADSGFKVALDSDPDAGSKDEGFLPMELMAISLAGCTAMDVISILLKKQQAVSSFEVRVQADRATDFPKVFTHAVITYLVFGHAVQEAAVVRSIELSATKYCPAQGMLGKVFPIDLVYEIYETGADNSTSLVAKGKYQPVAA